MLICDAIFGRLLNNKNAIVKLYIDNRKIENGDDKEIDIFAVVVDCI